MVIKIIVNDYNTEEGDPFTLQYPVEDKDFYLPLIKDFLRKGFVLTIFMEGE